MYMMYMYMYEEKKKAAGKITKLNLLPKNEGIDYTKSKTQTSIKKLFLTIVINKKSLCSIP